MKWSNVRLIFARELRDQLRDRRMIFMIAVLPVVLYPLLGLFGLQVSQFTRERTANVLIVGAEHLPELPRLLDANGKGFAEGFKRDAKLLTVTTSPPGDAPAAAERAQLHIRSGRFDAVLIIPSGFGEQLQAFREQVDRGNSGGVPDAGAEGADGADGASFPAPVVYFDAAKDQSNAARQRVDAILAKWRRDLVQESLRRQKLSARIVEPFRVAAQDVAEPASLRAAQWSKLLPFIVVIWALTGAFYPAIDLCAGEKERGTLETLLSSPAQRSEIVWGKLLTIMTFSCVTSLLNLICMGLTFSKVVGAATMMEAPSLSTISWLLLGLLPIAALFSALSLAIAAFARSTKEGQYYLMPLLLVTLPLMLLPMVTEMNMGTALIPISGLMLLIRTLIEGELYVAAVHAAPVVLVTGGCCWLAIRWAVHQFHQESVLFRESERFGLGAWIRQLMRDREATPTVAQAVLCATVLLMIRFYSSLSDVHYETWSEFVATTLVVQLALIATPVLLMALMLTRRPLVALGVSRPTTWWTIPAACGLAVALHPLAQTVKNLVLTLYPISDATMEQLGPLESVLRAAPWWQALLLLALVPAICEELAFRGFILSGLRHTGNKWAAICVTAAVFGISHVVVQQSLLAGLMGVAVGYVCVHCGSILPAMAFHFTHNSLGILSGRIDDAVLEKVLGWPAALAGAMVAAAIFEWMRRSPYPMYPEEELHARVDQPTMSDLEKSVPPAESQRTAAAVAE